MKLTEARAGVTKRTRDRRVKAFAAETAEAFSAVVSFVATHCSQQDEAMEALTKIIDNHIDISCRMLAWGRRNKVAVDDFVCDVLNACNPGRERKGQNDG
jgi:hypothetical protein